VRRHHQIPNYQRKRSCLAEFHACHLTEAIGKPKGLDSPPVRGHSDQLARRKGSFSRSAFVLARESTA
jgi:hypothetical protein